MSFYISEQTEEGIFIYKPLQIEARLLKSTEVCAHFKATLVVGAFVHINVQSENSFSPGSPVPSSRWEMNPTSYFCSLTISKMHHKHRDHITVYFININKDRKTLLVIKRLPRL